MCKAQEKNNLKREVTGAIRMLRADGASDETIITKVMVYFMSPGNMCLLFLHHRRRKKGLVKLLIEKQKTCGRL